MSYQLTKLQFCRLSLASFIDDSEERHHDVISYCWDLKISKFLKLYIDFYLSKFQIFLLSGSNFMEVSVRYHNFQLFLVITSL